MISCGSLRSIWRPQLLRLPIRKLFLQRPRATRPRIQDPTDPSLRRLTFGMAAPARFAGRPGGNVLATEVAAVLTLGGLTAATFVRAVLHPRYPPYDS
jgi:hypothetical protein